MKATLLLLAPVALFASCSQNSGQVGSPVAPAVNPGNQYGVPSAQPPGAYNPPYQQVGDINRPATSVPAANPYGAPAPTPVRTVPAVPPPSPDLNGNVYTIKKGDSLWGLSRKFGTSVDAIKEANGLSSDTIIDGRSIIIPGR